MPPGWHFKKLLYGLRYLNYTAQYRAAGTPADLALSDHNVDIIPVIGYRLQLEAYANP